MFEYAQFYIINKLPAEDQVSLEAAIVVEWRNTLHRAILPGWKAEGEQAGSTFALVQFLLDRYMKRFLHSATN